MSFLINFCKGVKSTGKQSDDKQYLSPNILTSASTLIDLAIKGKSVSASTPINLMYA